MVLIGTLRPENLISHTGNIYARIRLCRRGNSRPARTNALYHSFPRHQKLAEEGPPFGLADPEVITQLSTNQFSAINALRVL
jgi:hypothetical protein